MNIIIKIASIFADTKVLRQITKTLGLTPRRLFKLFTDAPEEFAKQLGKLSREQRKIISENIQKKVSGSIESANLSSSWIKKGQWIPIGIGSVGDLTIWTKKGKHGYTYPGVEKKIWKAMKRAKGRNGGGAGSVFWALYLRAFKKSTFGQFQKRMQYLSGVKGIK